ncbi:regulatory protein RecX [Treponema sp.]|uniref:regulatory protein RecX n=1 Tax=Treponema sp. TaxID=166 RepID=UPI003EFF39E5
MRTDYLSLLDASVLCDGAEFSDEEAADLLEAALAYAAETAAMSYLSRAEQCRFGLERKLHAKGIEKSAVNKALDYLEGCGYLSDERFAGAWLRNRAIDHTEGRIRLAAELASRGIESGISKRALDEFFSDRDEFDICRRAYKKQRLFESNAEKIKAALIRKGFTLKQIEAAVLQESS